MYSLQNLFGQSFFVNQPKVISTIHSVTVLQRSSFCNWTLGMHK